MQHNISLEKYIKRTKEAQDRRFGRVLLLPLYFNLMFIFWILLAWIGQAAALHLIDAGTRLHYQHYRPFSSPLALFVLVFQGLLVLFMAARNRDRIREWSSRFGFLRLIGHRPSADHLLHGGQGVSDLRLVNLG